MSKRIYVGNLPWSVTYEKLKQLFSSFGDIEEALVIANKYTGRSRGFGFVTFKKDEAADNAIKEMSEKEVEGRKLVVKEAMPQGERKSEEKHREKEESHTEEKSSKEKKERKPRKEKKKEEPEEE